MTQAPERRSFRPDTSTIAAAEDLVKNWPDISPTQAKRIASLLRSSRQVNA